MSQEIDRLDHPDGTICTMEEKQRLQPCVLLKCVMMSGDSPQSAQESKILPSNNYDEKNTTTTQPKAAVILNKATNNINVDDVEKIPPIKQNILSVQACNSQTQVERSAFEMESASKETNKCERCIEDCLYCTCQLCDCTIL